MVEEKSHLALFIVNFLGDPLMVDVLLVSILLFTSITISVAFWRISRRVVQVLNDQKEIKTLLMEALAASRNALRSEASPLSVPQEPQKIPRSMNPVSPSPRAELEAQEEKMPRTIVQTYRAGKSLYLLYSDGSVEADTDGHIQTFASIHLLKEAMARKSQNSLRSAS